MQIGEDCQCQYCNKELESQEAKREHEDECEYAVIQTPLTFVRKEVIKDARDGSYKKVFAHFR